MANRFYGYQYDTNPRKLNYEYRPYRNKYPEYEKRQENRKRDITNDDLERIAQKSRKRVYERSYNNRENYISGNLKNKEVNNRTNSKTSVKTSNSIKTKTDTKKKVKILLCLIASFSVLYAISYQNSLISQTFNKKEQYKEEMEALSKTNQQLEVNIENSLNLNNIEQAAKDKLGMQKLTNEQKVYVSLPKQDYVASASEQVVIEEDLGFFEKLIKGFTNVMN